MRTYMSIYAISVK